MTTTEEQITKDAAKRIAQAEERARKVKNDTEREVSIRKTLLADFPHLPQPTHVHFTNGGWKERAPEINLVWEMGAGYAPDDHTTPGGFFREARRVLEAFDWHTLCIWQNGCISVGSEESIIRPDAAEGSEDIWDGCLMTVDGGKGFGPTVRLEAWTRLRGVGEMVNIEVRLEGRALPQMELPHVKETPQGRNRPILREKVYPRIDHARRLVRYWSSEDSIHATYCFETDDWAHFADLLRAKMGD